MTFAQMLKTVINETFDFLCPLKIDLDDGSIYHDVEEVVIDKGFVIIKLRKEVKVDGRQLEE